MLLISVNIPAGIYLSKVTMKTPKKCESVQKHQKDVSDFVLVSLFVTLNRFDTLFLCFHCWRWTSKYRARSWSVNWQFYCKIKEYKNVSLFEFIKNSHLHNLRQSYLVILVLFIDFNPLSTNPTAEELFECVWPFCGVGA